MVFRTIYCFKNLEKVLHNSISSTKRQRTMQDFFSNFILFDFLDFVLCTYICTIIIKPFT